MLVEISLRGANLEEADLRDAIMGETSLERANLRGALVEGCNIDYTDKRNTIMPDGQVVTDKNYNPGGDEDE